MIRILTVVTAIASVFVLAPACQTMNPPPPLLAFDPGGREPVLLSASVFDNDRAITECEGAGVVLAVVFSHHVDPSSKNLQPESFAIRTREGRTLQPDCVTLSPSLDPLERRTVFLGGDFAGDRDALERISVSGDLRTRAYSWGQLSFKGTEASIIDTRREGPRLVLGERVMVADSWCAANVARQAVRLTWTAPMAVTPEVNLEDIQVTIMNKDGVLERISPTRLEDNDGDNHHELCLMHYGLPLEVHIDAGAFAAQDTTSTTAARVEVSY